MDNITFELIPADPNETKFYFVVIDNERGEVLHDTRKTRNNNGKNTNTTYGRTYSRNEAYMRAWIVKKREEARCQQQFKAETRGRPKSFSQK